MTEAKYFIAFGGRIMERMPDGSTFHLSEDSDIEEALNGHPMDTRWRPMRSAPRDGTVVEVIERGTLQRFQRAMYRPEPDGWSLVGIVSGHAYKVNEDTLMTWRPAHPEWQEGGE